MKIRFLISVLLFFSEAPCSFGQDKMIVDQTYNGSTFYGYSAKPAHSVTQLPNEIQHNLKGYFRRVLGSMSDSLTFSHGQIVNLKSYFEDRPDTYEYGWTVPMYDLNFVLKDESIGIRKYYLQIKLDPYGQILYWLSSSTKCNTGYFRKEFNRGYKVMFFAGSVVEFVLYPV